MYHMVLCFHHMCFTWHFYLKLISNACPSMLLIKFWLLNLNPFFCAFAGIVQKLTSTVLSATSFMEQSVDRTEGMYPDSPGDWDMLRFKIHFYFPSKEILIIFSFIHIIHIFTQEFIAELNSFFFSQNFSSGTCFDFATFLKTAVIVNHLPAMMGFFIPLIRDEEKKYEKFRTYIAILELSTLNCNSFAMSIICAGIWSGFQSTKRTILYPVALIAYGLSWSDTEAVLHYNPQSS